MALVEWVFAEKTGIYKKNSHSGCDFVYTLSVIQVVGAIVTFKIPPKQGGARALHARGMPLLTRKKHNIGTLWTHTQTLPGTNCRNTKEFIRAFGLWTNSLSSVDLHQDFLQLFEVFLYRKGGSFTCLFCEINLFILLLLSPKISIHHCPIVSTHLEVQWRSFTSIEHVFLFSFRA